LSDKVAEFSVPLQVTGDIITTEELKEISTVDEETVQEFTELTIKQPETNIKADLEIIREQVAELSDKVAEFSVPLQVTGDIITTEELKEISTVDEETVQEAMADWGDDLKGHYENLLRTEEIQEEK
jgi:DNA-binding transcriptional regulator YiaG